MFKKQMMQLMKDLKNGVVVYDNATSGLTSTNVKNAIDELKTYVDNSVGSLNNLDIQIVETLPTTGEVDVLYLVPSETGFLDEFVWDTTTEEFLEIGHADLDLSTYATITYVDGQIATLDGKITALDTRVGALETTVTSHGTKITTLEGKVTTNEGAISTINANITSINTNIDTVEADIVDLDTRVTINEGEITNIKSDATTLAGRVSTNETDIVNLETAVAGINGVAEFTHSVVVEDWTLGVDGLYEVVITHNLGQKIFNFDALNGNNSHAIACEIVDLNNTKIFSIENVALDVKALYKVTQL